MNIKKIVLIVSIFLVHIFTSFAQNLNYVWSKSIGGTSDERINSMVIDASGNVYSTGYFSGTVDFDPSAGIFNLTGTTASGSAFVSKLDANGNFVWAKSIHSILPADCSGESLAIDVSGNVYITGKFLGTADFDPDTSTFNLTSNGGYDIFISKLDSSGNLVWAKSMGDQGASDIGYSIAVDGSSNVYCSGVFGGTVDFNPGADTFNLYSNGNDDIFISKLDSSGNFIWTKSFGSVNDDLDLSLALDSAGNVYTTGYFSGLTDFDPGAGVFNLTIVGIFDIFISKLDSSGNFMWAKAIGGTNFDYSYSITLDDFGNVYTVGSFRNTVDFDPGPGTHIITATGSGYDVFISKLNSSGNFIWVKSFGTFSDEEGFSIAVDDIGNVYTTGSFYDVVDFDPGIGIYNLTSTGDRDIFISKLDSSGNFIWAKSMGGIAWDNGYCIALDSSRNVYISGYYYSNYLSIGPDTLINADNSSHSSDIFIAKLAINSWRSCDAMPQFADYAAGFVTGGYAYVGTGQDSSGNYLTNIYKFNPGGAGMWSSISNYPNAARAKATGFSLNEYGFIGLGYDGNIYNDFLEYYPGSDTWNATSRALNWNNGGAPTRYYSVAFTIGNTAYVGLGKNESGSVYDDFYSFDGINWTPIAPFPGGQRCAAVAFTIGDTAYVGTGLDASGNAHQDFYAFDPVNGWHANAINLGIGNERANAIAFSIGKYGFVALGGDGNGTNCKNDLWQYNPLINSFTQKTSLPSTNLYNYAFGFSLNGKGYVCMGGECDGANPSNETWEYIPEDDVTASVVGIKEIINNQNIVSSVYPNPVTDRAVINVSLNSANLKNNTIILIVQNILGQFVDITNKINNSKNGNITINIQKGLVSPGIYIYKIMDGNNLLITGKFIVE